MPIISAVDEEDQIIHVTIDTKRADEEYYKSMSELMSIISNFDQPKLLIEDTEIGKKIEKNLLKRVLTFNLETLKYLNKIAICSLHEPDVLHEISEFCMSQNTLCKNFNNIELAKKWLKAK